MGRAAAGIASSPLPKPEAADVFNEDTACGGVGAWTAGPAASRQGRCCDSAEESSGVGERAIDDPTPSTEVDADEDDDEDAGDTWLEVDDVEESGDDVSDVCSEEDEGADGAERFSSGGDDDDEGCAMCIGGRVASTVVDACDASDDNES